LQFDASTRAREIAHCAFDPGVTHKPNDTIRINPVPSTRSPLIAWIHRTALPGLTIWRLLAEIKHDGYRLQVRREGDAVRLFMRRGYDWTGRYPAIAVTAMLLRAKSFTLDGEAVVCGPDGVAIFDALHRRGTVTAPR
jgi:ATP-dependent DNA ligase